MWAIMSFRTVSGMLTPLVHCSLNGNLWQLATQLVAELLGVSDETPIDEPETELLGLSGKTPVDEPKELSLTCREFSCLIRENSTATDGYVSSP